MPFSVLGKMPAYQLTHCLAGVGKSTVLLRPDICGKEIARVLASLIRKSRIKKFSL